jgi:Protein of unknown function (DUF3040)
LALDDADRRSLEEIERRLELEHPRLARSLRREPAHLPRLQVLPVVIAVLILFAGSGWLAVQGGTVLPLLLAVVPAAAAIAVLRWQRAKPIGDDAPNPAPDPPDGGPPP